MGRCCSGSRPQQLPGELGCSFSFASCKAAALLELFIAPNHHRHPTPLTSNNTNANTHMRTHTPDPRLRPCRLEAGRERLPLEAASGICLALVRLGFQPRSHWSPERRRHVNILDDLGAALADGLPAAKPQASMARREGPPKIACSGCLKLFLYWSCGCGCKKVLWTSTGLSLPKWRSTCSGPMTSAITPSCCPRLQAVSGYLVGLGLVSHAPPAPVLSNLLQHLASFQGHEPPAGQGANVGSPSDGSGAGATGGSAHRRDKSRGQPCPAAGRLEEGGCNGLLLQRLSGQELADLVCSLRRILCSVQGQVYSGSDLPPAVLEGFFDALDTVLHARACLATRFSPGAASELSLTGQHVGAILHALARLAASWPCAMLT